MGNIINLIINFSPFIIISMIMYSMAILTYLIVNFKELKELDDEEKWPLLIKFISFFLIMLIASLIILANY